MDHSSSNRWLCTNHHHIGVLLKRKGKQCICYLIPDVMLYTATNCIYNTWCAHLLLGWLAHRVLRRWWLEPWVAIWWIPRHWLSWWHVPGLGRWVPRGVAWLERQITSLGRWVLGWVILWWSWWTPSLRFYGSWSEKVKNIHLSTHILHNGDRKWKWHTK